MDQLSMSTWTLINDKSITSIAAVAASTARAFKELRGLCNTLPSRLHALGNEVSDIQLILHQVALVVEQVQANQHSRGKRHISSIYWNKLGPRLEELKVIVDTLIEFAKTAETSTFRVYIWRRNQLRLRAMQEDIKAFKCSLNFILGASNSRDMMRVRVDLGTITTSSPNSAQSQLSTEQNCTLASFATKST